MPYIFLTNPLISYCPLTDNTDVRVKSDNIRWNLVAKARARIADGKYFDELALRHILSPRCLDNVLSDLNKCPVGSGHPYRDFVAESLCGILDGVVDAPLCRREISAAGGRADIELPLQIETINAFPVWADWSRRYAIRSILVETKNEKNQATVADVSQLAGYFGSTKLSRFGILVARNGFSRSSYQNMATMARNGESLIIPLDHANLNEFARASRHSAQESMRYLRRRETLLLQS